jgi:dihydroorotate dehydrogenase (NAD+) catalytic subunit
LTPTVTDISITAQAAVDAGADALSLVNTFTAMVVDIDKQKPVLANRTGGLSGPAIKPMAVYLVNKVYNEVAKDAGIPILGMGGVRTAADALEFIIAGATAVAVGTATFVYPDTAEKVVVGLRNYCRNKGISDVRELIGCLR